jgi:dihydroorotate dehydrogenase (NAD+) catalytic subunit
MERLKTKLPGMSLDNPIMPASGTFGFGFDYVDYYDLNILGSIITKAVTGNQRFGNPTPRIAEVSSGMLNAIGLQNLGAQKSLNEFAKLNEIYHKKVIANVAGSSIQEYVDVIKQLNHVENIGAYEINISCPNVKEGGIAFGSRIDLAEEVTRACKNASTKPVYIKLSPNVTDIVAIAKAVENAGADAISLINTVVGMKIDVKTRKPVLSNLVGGLSGPAIKPIAIRMVYQVYQAVKIPIIGMGGIQDAKDVLEFLLAGASAVCVGTANLIDPKRCHTIINDLEKTLDEYGFETIASCIGAAHEKRNHSM